jgi:hypothetical protein
MRTSCQLLRIEGVAWSAQRIPTVVNLGFLDRSSYFFFQVAPQLSSRENLEAPGIESGTSGSVAKNSGTKLANKRRSLGPYSSLADQNHGV